MLLVDINIILFECVDLCVFLCVLMDFHIYIYIYIYISMSVVQAAVHWIVDNPW